MKCKTCGLEVPANTSYTCSMPGQCDFGNNGWNKITDSGTPQNNDSVLCYDSKFDEVFKGYYNTIQNLWWKLRGSYDTYDQPEKYVTHWMPLPQKPIF